MEPTRPSPESLLQRAQAEDREEQRGKLKIYLGAAPGVGKTYTMLQDALAKRSQGLDVVIGVVESHGRKEIEAMLQGCEILPRQIVQYRGKDILEFDLDAAIKRHPGLLLVDEMAHANASGLRHAKRWQDIKEILDRGIDVYTTLNVQHIESLNDVVKQIIQVPIKETVPDTMLESADTIELIDLPPEDLLRRLQEGKVYFPAQVELAKKNFFKKSNLAVLRELALRVTAENVQTQVLLYRQGEGVKRIWPVQEKILVCVGPNADSIKIIRAARRMATSFHAEWIAVHVETPKIKLTEELYSQAIQNLRLAEQLGAKTHILIGFDVVKEIMAYAREQNVTQIMLWKHIRPRWRNLFGKNLTDEIIRHSGDIDIYIMTGDDVKTTITNKLPLKQNNSWKSYIAALGIVALATGIDFLLAPFLSSSNLIMLYLLGTTIVSLLGRVGPAIFASILSVLAYDFFFVPPIYSFSITDIQYFLTLVVMLVVSQTISHLTILSRRQTEISRNFERYTSALHDLSRRLSSMRGIDKLLEVSVRYIGETFDSSVSALMPAENNHLVTRASYKTKHALDVKEQSVARWAYDLAQPAGLGTDTLPSSEALYIPLIATKGSVGVLQILPLDSQYLFTPEQMHLLESCANQIALAIEADRSDVIGSG